MRSTTGATAPIWRWTDIVAADGTPSRVKGSGGFCIWLTGLSGAGKSTIARCLAADLVDGGQSVETLDGDSLRAVLSPDLGFSRTDRETNVLRVAWVASRLVRASSTVIVALMSPFAAGRQRARQLVEEFGPFIEVFVDTPVDVCIERDPKGLYRRALAGDVADMVGLDVPYEMPNADFLRVPTIGRTPTHSARDIVEHLRRRGLVHSPSELTTSPTDVPAPLQ
jgi:adenylyl-sulfate kinase